MGHRPAPAPEPVGTIPVVTELQSEGGVICAVHGALQAGALATTFTASYHWIRTGRRGVGPSRRLTIDASGTNSLITITGKLLPDLGAERNSDSSC